MKLDMHFDGSRRRSMHRLAAAGALTLASTFLVGCGQKKESFTSVDITGADYAKDFELTDHNGVVRHMADFKGKVVVLFFGYTQCPDVCPTTMAELAEVKKTLGADGARLQPLFVTLDPERDTPELLKAYAENFGSDVLALRTTPEKLVGVAKDFKIYYKKVDGRTADSYTLDHSAGSYIYDAQGRVRLYAHYGTALADLTRDIKTLLAETV